MNGKLRAAIIGCGKIADTHASHMQSLGTCDIVGVCDREQLMALQLCDRFGIRAHFTDAADLLSEVRPDVVHITTPPQSHFPIARLCLESGCHVYIEKPFTLDAQEARALIELANETGLKLTVGHNYQCSHVARRMRALVANGYLGDRPVHMESHYGYDFGDGSYGRALLSDTTHWVRKLPGQLLHNIISHGIARIAEYLKGDTPAVIAHGFVSPVLAEMGESEMVDELRVIITDEERTTAYFTFSSQMKPSLHEFRIYGTKNGLFLDQDHEILIRLRGTKFRSYADHFIPPVSFARQHVANLVHNARLFLARDFHADTGMKQLIQSFYDSILRDTSPPIPYREILVTAHLMDSIFNQLSSRSPYDDILAMQPVAAG